MFSFHFLKECHSQVCLFQNFQSSSIPCIAGFWLHHIMSYSPDLLSIYCQKEHFPWKGAKYSSTVTSGLGLNISERSWIHLFCISLMWASLSDVAVVVKSEDAWYYSKGLKWYCCLENLVFKWWCMNTASGSKLLCLLRLLCF